MDNSIQYTLECSRALKTLILRSSGYKLDELFVRKNIIKSLDDVPYTSLFTERIGILDVVDELLNTVKMNIYVRLRYKAYRYTDI